MFEGLWVFKWLLVIGPALCMSRDRMSCDLLAVFTSCPLSLRRLLADRQHQHVIAMTDLATLKYI